MFTLPKELRENYVARRKTDFEVLLQSLKNNSIEEFKNIGHQLAGNAESYGFPELGKLGIKMELLNERNLKSEGSQLVAAFKNWIETVVVDDDFQP